LRSVLVIRKREEKMKERYDLVVVGAGPAGLMAAKTAAETGLKVALIERKENIVEIRRACSMMLVSLSGRYLNERVTLTPGDQRLSFPYYGFSVPYKGPHKNFYTWQICSHKGHKIQIGGYEENFRKGDSGRASAIYSKEVLLAGLLQENILLNVDVFHPYNVIGAIHEGRNVRVVTREGKSFKGTFVIAADGRSSRLARSLGLNQERKFFGTAITMGYEMVGAEIPEEFSLFQIFLNEEPLMRAWITPRTNDQEHFVMVTSLNYNADFEGAFERFTKQGIFSTWFKRAEKKRKLSSVGNMLSHIIEPYKDQVLFTGDTIWCQEAEMTGAVISGWKAANAVALALLEGKISKEGVADYLTWWKEVVLKEYDYQNMIRNVVLPYVLTPEEMDFLLSLFKKPLPSVFDPYETPKLIGQAMAEVMPIIARERPVIMDKLKKMGNIPLEKVFSGCIRSGFPAMSMV
jgi:flavin-dependent dehydrogenase